MNTKRIKILLVEDEALISMAEEMVLKNAGYDVVIANNGEDSIEKVKNDQEISVVLMDINLGTGIEGTEAAEKILSFTDIPIIFLTSHSEKEVVDKVKGITKYGYVIKNSGDFVLLESIVMALELFEANKKVKHSEIRHREIVANIDAAIIEFDNDGIIKFFNKGAERIFGYKSDETIGKKSIDTINPKIDSEGKNHEEMLVKIFNEPERYRFFHNENITKSGERIHISWINKSVYDEYGQKVYILSIGTPTQMIKRMMNHSGYNYQNFFYEAPVGMALSRYETGEYIDVNELFLEKTGYKREELLGKVSIGTGLISPEVRQNIAHLLKSQREINDVQIKGETRDGDSFICLCNSKLMEMDGEKLILTMVKDFVRENSERG